MSKVASLLLIVAIATSCRPAGSDPGDPSSGRPKPPAMTLDEATKTLAQPAGQQVVTGANAAGFKLLLSLSQATPEQNLCISPASIAIACEIAGQGAKGETKAGIEKTFGADGIADKPLREAARSLSTVLMSADPKVELQIANSLWVAPAVSLKTDFQDIAYDIFDARAASVDFGTAAGIKTVNDWVIKATKGHIQSMIDAPNAGISLMILDAVYFKGPWSKPFDKRATSNGDFHLANGQTLQAPMMHQGGSYLYAKTASGQILNLPYAGGRLAMVVYLPDQGASLSDFVSTLDAASWATAVASMHSESVDLAIPKFKTAYRCPLKYQLANLGMAVACVPGRADFSAMTDKPIYISDVLHKTTTEVSEEGTVATASTAITGMATSAMPSPAPPPPIEFIVDRPFLYTIGDTVTGAILFAGLVYNPVMG